MKRVDFGIEAARYIRSQLADGNGLSRQLIRLRPKHSKYWAFVPDKAPADVLRQFRSGGLGGRPETETSLIEFIQYDLHEARGRCAVFEDAFARKGDPLLGDSGCPYFTHGADVFDFLIGPSQSDDVRQLLWTARAYRMVGVLSDAVGLELPQEADEETLQLLASQARHVIIGAWDGEGELVWSLDGREPSN